MALGIRLEDIRRHNSRITFDVIRLNGPITRVKIAELTGLTPAAISSLTRDLITQEMIVEKGRQRGQRGQPAVELEINPNARFAIGVDLDRDHLTGIAINLAGEILAEVHAEWQYPPPEVALPFIVEQVNDLFRQVTMPAQRILGVGVAMPGPFLTGEKKIVFPQDFPHWENFPLVEKLQELLGLPVILENNARAAAIGEQFHGEGRLYGDFFYLLLGARLGGAMISNSRPYQERSPHAAQLGRIQHVSKKRLTVGLRDLYNFLQGRGIQVADPQAVEALFHQKNPYLWEWLNEIVEQLHTIVEAINGLLSPDVIFWGGHFPEVIINYLIERLQIESVADRAAYPDSTILYQAKLLRATSGDLASAIGAATLPLYQTFATSMLHEPGEPH